MTLPALIVVRHSFDGWFYARGGTARFGFGSADAALQAAFRDVPGVAALIFPRAAA